MKRKYRLDQCGKLVIHEEFDTAGTVVNTTYEWKGSDIIAISDDFLREGDITWAYRIAGSELDPSIDDVYQIGPFHVRVVDFDTHGEDDKPYIWYAKRVPNVD